jgi:hypothetical protein
LKISAVDWDFAFPRFEDGETDYETDEINETDEKFQVVNVRVILGRRYNQR